MNHVHGIKYIKRLFVFALSLLFAVSLFAGCGKRSTETEDPSLSESLIGDVVELPADGIITADQFNAFAGTSRTISFVGSSDGISYTWDYNGRNIHNAVDMDLSIDFITDETALAPIKESANHAPYALGMVLKGTGTITVPTLTIIYPQAWEADTAVFCKQTDGKLLRMSDAQITTDPAAGTTTLSMKILEVGDTYYLVAGSSSASGKIENAAEGSADSGNNSQTGSSGSDNNGQAGSSGPENEGQAGNTGSETDNQAGNVGSDNGGQTGNGVSGNSGQDGNDNSGSANDNQTGNSGSGNGSQNGNPAAGTNSDGTSSGTNSNSSSSGNRPADNRPKETTAAALPKPETTAADTSTKKLTCTICINCSTILSNMDKLDSDRVEFVPDDGWILLPTEVEFTEGDSVLDILKAVCRAYKIPMEHNGSYVEGINQLYEFNCGELSGWMYSVDGWFPNYGADSYIVSDGETIRWSYTCDLGKDVGDNSQW